VKTVKEVGADVLFQHDLSGNRSRGLVEGWAAGVGEDFILRECRRNVRMKSSFASILALDTRKYGIASLYEGCRCSGTACSCLAS
jgi:hypothetical protein